MKKFLICLIVLALATPGFAATAVTMKNYSAVGTKLVPAICSVVKGIRDVDGVWNTPSVTVLGTYTTVRSAFKTTITDRGDYLVSCHKVTDKSLVRSLMYFDDASGNYKSVDEFLIRVR